jgi:hypothetical protein
VCGYVVAGPAALGARERVEMIAQLGAEIRLLWLMTDALERLQAYVNANP